MLIILTLLLENIAGDRNVGQFSFFAGTFVFDSSMEIDRFFSDKVFGCVGVVAESVLEARRMMLLCSLTFDCGLSCKSKW